MSLTTKTGTGIPYELKGAWILTCNVGGIEKPLRIVGGLLLIGVGALGGLPTVAMGIALTSGAVFLVTGVIGYCPLTSLLGINTCHPSSGAKK